MQASMVEAPQRTESSTVPGRLSRGRSDLAGERRSARPGYEPGLFSSLRIRTKSLWNNSATSVSSDGSEVSHRRREYKGRKKGLKADAAPDANDANAEQALLVTRQGTIWHAVCKADTLEGKESWQTATQSGSRMQGNEWMTGEGRGVMGETPLHLAVLFDSSTDHHRVMHALWDKYPALRIAQYNGQLYRGENVLHIAIVRKLDFSIIRTFVESAEGPELLRQRATGDFFKIPDLSDGCCNYGELPLCFAACTNQPKVFDYLVEHNAQLDCTTEQESHNLLHLIVLHSVHNRVVQTDLRDPHLDASMAAAHGADKKDKSAGWYRNMYDHIQEAMEKIVEHRRGPYGEKLESFTMYERLKNQRDVNKHTPLTLAAAVGSLDMFEHLLQKQMNVEWVFGPVICRKLYLEGIDIRLEREVKEVQTKHRSVLEVIVQHERLDILSQGHMKKILEAKWLKYARKRFQARFWNSVFYTVVLILVTVINPGDSVVYKILLLCGSLYTSCVYFGDFYREFKGFLHKGSFPTEFSLDAFQQLYPTIAAPASIFLAGCHVWRFWVLADSAARIGLDVTRVLLGSVWVEFSESVTLSLLSGLSFLNILLGLIGFSEYGNFALMLSEMLQHDVRIFFVIYSVFLFGFSHVHFISSQRVNEGHIHFVKSIQHIFKAILQKVDIDVEQGYYHDHVIGLTNFFLVSLVLTNLLIAMLSSTYHNISQEAKRRWELLRARIVVAMDKQMTDAERSREEHSYWQIETTTNRRFMTFTSSENRENYLSQN